MADVMIIRSPQGRQFADLRLALELNGTGTWIANMDAEVMQELRDANAGFCLPLCDKDMTTLGLIVSWYRAAVAEGEPKHEDMEYLITQTYRRRIKH